MSASVLGLFNNGKKTFAAVQFDEASQNNLHMHSEWDCFNIKVIALSVLFKISHKNHSYATQDTGSVKTADTILPGCARSYCRHKRKTKQARRCPRMCVCACVCVIWICCANELDVKQW